MEGEGDAPLVADRPVAGERRLEQRLRLGEVALPKGENPEVAPQKGHPAGIADALEQRERLLAQIDRLGELA
jgi:hypothetical protein